MAKGDATCRRTRGAGMGEVACREVRRAMRAAEDGPRAQGRYGSARCARRLCPRVNFTGPVRHWGRLRTDGDAGLASLQRLLRRSACIDHRPIDPAEIVVLLKSGNCGRGVGCVVLAMTDAP